MVIHFDDQPRYIEQKTIRQRTFLLAFEDFQCLLKFMDLVNTAVDKKTSVLCIDMSTPIR